MRKTGLLLFLAFTTCKPGTVAPRYPTNCPNDEPLLETATVNWGVAPGVVALATPRIAPIAEEVKNLRGAGILCFQELWTKESKDAVTLALGPDMHTYYVETRGENERPGIDVCLPGEIGGLAACGKKHCSAEPDEEQTICTLRACHDELVNLYISGGRECLNCLTASVGHPVDEIVKICEQPTLQSTIQGASRAYDGQNGVLLASRWPLKNPEALRLRASFSNRVALFATIELAGSEPIEVACTHLSTWNELPPNHPEFSDWDGEMIGQVEDISKRLFERAGKRPSLFMGDMNTGPSRGGDVVEAMPKVWRRIESLWFRSPAACAEPAFCSTCSGNTLRSPTARSYVIDHVLLRDPKGGTELEPVCAHPFIDQRRRFPGYDGGLVDSHLSDHYGVIVKFRVK